MKRSVDVPVHDIFPPLVVVPDGSVYVFLALLLAGAGMFLMVYRLRQRLRNTHPDERSERLEGLKKIDLSNSKKAAYAICEQGRFFADQTPQTHDIYDTLCERLEAYKYAPKVPSIDAETRELYRNFVEMIESPL